jgi:hypothetical protein
VGAEDPGEEFAGFDVGEEIGVGLGVGFVAQLGEGGLDFGAAAEAGAGGAGVFRIRVGEGVEVGGGGGVAFEEAADEFLV